MDVREEHQVEMAVRYIQDNLPAGCNGLWAVINNAGLCVCGEFDWQTLDQIRDQLVNMDVREEHQVEMAVRYIQDNLPAGCNGLWAVINNAGLCVCGEIDD